MTQVWTTDAIKELYELPFLELLYRAHSVHRAHFDATKIDLCNLLSIKTGSCPEDCAYCPQSGRFKTGIEKESLLSEVEVLKKAKLAKNCGAKRFCMGAAWRSPPKKDLPKVLTLIKQVKALGLETCVTLGTLDDTQAMQLKEAGLDYYNHNIDTSENYYKKIITSHTYQDRLDTLDKLRKADIQVCCGGIVGLGETREDRIQFLQALANMSPPPKSVPINRLIRIKGTPLADNPPLSNFEFIRTIAVARILMPQSIVRLSGGRLDMSYEMQALSFMAGANSIHFGEKFLTTPTPDWEEDKLFLKEMGIQGHA